MSDTNPSELSEDEIRVNTLREDVDRTRSQMSSTIQALQEKLEPEGLREKAASELENVEKHVKAAVREELLEVKAILKEELQEAKVAVNEVIENAKLAVKEDAIALKDSVKQDVIAAKDAVKEDVKHAIASAKRETRAATLGRLEDIATQAGDVMNDTKETLVETIRQNPIPAALVGFGLAWLLMNRSSSASQRRSGSFEGGSRERGVRTFDRGYSQSYGRDDSYPTQGSSSQGRSGIDSAGDALSGVRHRVDGLAHDATDAAGNALRKAKDAASSTLGHAADASSKLAHDVTDTASGLANRVADAGSQLAHDAADKTSHLWHDATDASGRAYERVSSTVSEYAHEVPRQARRAEQAAGGYYMGNPLAIGAVALAAGALVGMALPRTDREDALLGEARDKFLVNARSVAHDAAEAVQHLGQDAAQNVKGVLAESSEA